ncbi:MAG: macro domain-containing protein [Armatimonadota bacterium]|nr:macro domain-containing protein [Armatimonadota bacterium]
MQTTIGRTRLELLEGDITEQDTDAIVNAARPDLLGGWGIDAAIHRKGGLRILDECIALGGCPIGEAVITTGGKLKARYVIHAVGPVYEEGDDYEEDLLTCAYESCLRLAAARRFTSLAFPSISTGAFCYPMAEAAHVALRTVINFLRQEEHNLSLVRFVLDAPEDPAAYSIYAQALSRLAGGD